ncbi:MAG TPA: 2-hydroxychromene-2-carboxylate isomerase [Myxococcales bacterium]|nr:2-hydroxychromene-2-carboxylate isomerase [Myxococcales bacterium]HIM03570.1 2-hydroxychromene-2-carboxylate isomerase [Myxococcales bacterium]
MTEEAKRPQFKDQGGASSMNPPALVRFAMSKIISRIASAAAQRKGRAKSERARVSKGARRTVDYFHQVNDGYSHLAAQLLRPLLAAYDVDLVCHLVQEVRDNNLPEPELLLSLSRIDAQAVAADYGLHFPDADKAPDSKHVDLAERILAAVDNASFPEVVVKVGQAVWSDDATTLDALASEHGSLPREQADAIIANGNRRREKLGHYSGGMFHFGGQWYWGADRFYHLENWLIETGAQTDADAPLVCPRPAIESGPQKDNGSITLEFYPSMRSPYTSMIFDTTVALARDVGVNLVVRPVLPMVMRGVPVTQRKGIYIFKDTAREAETLGLVWGNMYDPIGSPVSNCYSLYPWACQQDKGTELLSAFANLAFFEGVNTNNDRGMQAVVERAGLSWAEAKPIMGNTDWEIEIEANRLAMYEKGLWGVPCYRLVGADGEEILALWGQDRLWLVAKEIQRALGRAESRSR